MLLMVSWLLRNLHNTHGALARCGNTSSRRPCRSRPHCPMSVRINLPVAALARHLARRKRKQRRHQNGAWPPSSASLVSQVVLLPMRPSRCVPGFRLGEHSPHLWPQYRVALSDAHHWEEHDGSFDYIMFYNNVVDYFESPPGPVAKLEVARILDWWNM